MGEPFEVKCINCGHPSVVQFPAPRAEPCVERGGTAPCTHHSDGGPAQSGPVVTGTKPPSEARAPLDVERLREAVDAALFDAEMDDSHPGCRAKWRRVAMGAFDAATSA